MEGGYGYPVAMANPIELSKDTTTCLQKVFSSIGGVGGVMGQFQNQGLTVAGWAGLS